jgi:hypothetical protein
MYFMSTTETKPAKKMNSSMKSCFASTDPAWRAEWLRRYGDKPLKSAAPKNATIIVYHK